MLFWYMCKSMELHQNDKRVKKQHNYSTSLQMIFYFYLLFSSIKQEKWPILAKEEKKNTQKLLFFSQVKDRCSHLEGNRNHKIDSIIVVFSASKRASIVSSVWLYNNQMKLFFLNWRKVIGTLVRKKRGKNEWTAHIHSQFY